MSNKRKTKIAAQAKRKAVHPKSRKAKQLNKAALRKDKMATQGKKSNVQQFSKGVDIMWFREALADGVKKYTRKDMKEIVARYVCRFDSELEDLRAKGGSAHKIMVLEEKIKLEKSRFEGQHGVEVPDLTNSDIVDRLRGWDGSLKEIPAIKQVLFHN